MLQPDLPNWAWHEYRMRVGFWRFLQAFESRGICATLSINGSVCERYPRLAAAARNAGWEFMGHGRVQVPVHRESDQRAMIHRPRHDRGLHRRAAGRMARPGLTETLETPDLLAEAGIRYVADRVLDDLPCRIETGLAARSAACRATTISRSWSNWPPPTDRWRVTSTGSSRLEARCFHVNQIRHARERSSLATIPLQTARRRGWVAQAIAHQRNSAPPKGLPPRAGRIGMAKKSDSGHTAKPTAAVAKQAAKGLELREKHGRGGTQVGLHRAQQLRDREAIDVATLKKMRAYFARHKVDKRGKNWADPGKPSAGYIAWLLWGGDEGRDWAEREMAKIED